MPAAATLAQIAKRVDHLIATYSIGILPFVNKLTAECPSVIALFEGADADGLRLYKHLGFEAEVPPGSVLIMDIVHQALDAALVTFDYEPIDELPSYEPGNGAALRVHDGRRRLSQVPAGRRHDDRAARGETDP